MDSPGTEYTAAPRRHEALAMAHGTVGVRGLAYDHTPRRMRRRTLALAYAFCLAVTALGSWVILTFPNPL